MIELLTTMCEILHLISTLKKKMCRHFKLRPLSLGTFWKGSHSGQTSGIRRPIVLIAEMITFIYREPHECINLLAIRHSLVIEEKIFGGDDVREKKVFFFLVVTENRSLFLHQHPSQGKSSRFPTLMFYYGHMTRSLETSKLLCASILFSGVDFRKDSVGVTFLIVPMTRF